MRKFFAAQVLCLLLVGSAFAVIDPNPDMLSFYFDTNADLVEYHSLDNLQAYLIVTNPTFAAITGLECYLDWDESDCLYQGFLLPPGGVNVGDHHNVILALSSAMATTEATVMVTYNLLPLDVVYFTLGAARPPSIEGILPVVVDGEYNAFQIGLTLGAGNICAILNSPPDDAQSQTWGSLKSLYR